MEYFSVWFPILWALLACSHLTSANLRPVPHMPLHPYLSHPSSQAGRHAANVRRDPMMAAAMQMSGQLSSTHYEQPRAGVLTRRMAVAGPSRPFQMAHHFISVVGQDRQTTHTIAIHDYGTSKPFVHIRKETLNPDKRGKDVTVPVSRWEDQVVVVNEASTGMTEATIYKALAKTMQSVPLSKTTSDSGVFMSRLMQEISAAGRSTIAGLDTTRADAFSQRSMQAYSTWCKERNVVEVPSVLDEVHVTSNVAGMDDVWSVKDAQGNWVTETKDWTYKGRDPAWKPASGRPATAPGAPGRPVAPARPKPARPKPALPTIPEEEPEDDKVRPKGWGLCFRSEGGACAAGSEQGKGVGGSIAADVATTENTVSLRIGGVLQDIVVVGAKAAAAAGVASLVASPGLIIYDFVKGNKVGGAFGIASGVLGAATLATAEFPPIAVLCAALSLVFAILPLAWNQNGQKLPDPNNATQIIQYVIFGDKDHTGNEKCQAGINGQAGNPECQAVYGPNVVGGAFSWDNNFDAVAFLLWANQGYPMSIPDMAKAFVINGSDVSGPQVATIQCHQKKCLTIGCDRGCDQPTFALQRRWITIPGVNQTADKVYDRVLPNPGGDCNLLDDVSAQTSRGTNVTHTGAPVAIACGLTASSAALANASTDGAIHSVVAPQPPTGFADVLDASNAVCFDNKLCLPSATYSVPSGKLGVDLASLSNMTMPQGGSMSFTVFKPAPGQRQTQAQTITYTTNETSSDGAFATNMKILTREQGRTFNVSLPAPEAPVLCLFTDINYQGDVVCYGPGSGNVSVEMANQAQSVGIQGNITAYAYGIVYGDPQGLLIRTSIPDLSARFLGDHGTFTKAIKALWIIDNSDSDDFDDFVDPAAFNSTAFDSTALDSTAFNSTALNSTTFSSGEFDPTGLDDQVQFIPGPWLPNNTCPDNATLWRRSTDSTDSSNATAPSGGPLDDSLAPAADPSGSQTTSRSIFFCAYPEAFEDPALPASNNPNSTNSTNSTVAGQDDGSSSITLPAQAAATTTSGSVPLQGDASSGAQSVGSSSGNVPGPSRRGLLRSRGSWSAISGLA